MSSEVGFLVFFTKHNLILSTARHVTFLYLYTVYKVRIREVPRGVAQGGKEDHILQRIDIPMVVQYAYYNIIPSHMISHYEIIYEISAVCRAPVASARTSEETPPVCGFHRSTEILRLCQLSAFVGDTHTLWRANQNDSNHPQLPRRHAGSRAYGWLRALGMVRYHAGRGCSKAA